MVQHLLVCFPGCCSASAPHEQSWGSLGSPLHHPLYLSAPCLLLALLTLGDLLAAAAHWGSAQREQQCPGALAGICPWEQLVLCHCPQKLSKSPSCPLREPNQFKLRLAGRQHKMDATNDNTNAAATRIPSFCFPGKTILLIETKKQVLC